MLRILLLLPIVSLLNPATFLLGQNAPTSDPQAVSFATQSVAALTGGTSVSDVTLTGNVTWNAGADSGTATLIALGTGESRMDLALSSGTRTEIRDSSTGTAQGQWVAPDGSSGPMAFQNCITDASWFFPTLGSLAGEPNVVLTYIGQESRDGAVVQHLQSYAYQPGQSSNKVAATLQQLSVMDFYLDGGTLLPTAITFNSHPDDDATANLTVEVDFSDYQSFGVFLVPTRIQKYIQGNLLIDLTVSNASFNTGLSLSNFAIN